MPTDFHAAVLVPFVLASSAAHATCPDTWTLWPSGYAGATTCLNFNDVKKVGRHYKISSLTSWEEIQTIEESVKFASALNTSLISCKDAAAATVAVTMFSGRFGSGVEVRKIEFAEENASWNEPVGKDLLVRLCGPQAR